MPALRLARLRKALAAALAAAWLVGALPAAAADDVAVPNYWDTRRKTEPIRPGSARVIRFLVDDDYPPFHYNGPDGTLTGFSVDLARALCGIMATGCTVQARRWDTLLDSLAESRGDAVIAAMRITPEIKQRFIVTSPWHRSPARFVARVAGPVREVSPAALVGRSVAVVEGSAHEAYLKAFFPGANPVRAADTLAALGLVRSSAADLAFGDGVALAIWLNGTDSGGCCAFRGGPYLESAFFGEGVGIILRPEDRMLRQALDAALAIAAERGTYAELYLRYFPMGFY